MSLPPPNDQVTALPGLSSDWSGVQFAGFASIFGTTNPMPSGFTDQGLFYWFVGTEDYATRPTVVWTNGGPGSSSFWGFFLENGPFIISKNGDNFTVTPRADGWVSQVNYMIFEHPLGVTFSQPTAPSYVPTSPEMGVGELYQALLNFMTKHPEIAATPLILAGESYAGTYLPLLASAILDGNQSGQLSLDLKLTVLMDAWVDPIIQLRTSTQYALTHGLISQAQKDQLDSQYTSANPAAPDALNNISSAIGALSGVYLTNIAQTADPDTTVMIEYLNTPAVMTAINVPPSCQFTQLRSAQVSNNYLSATNNSYRITVDHLLDRGAHLMLVSGLNDAKDCNVIGTGQWVAALYSPLGKAVLDQQPLQWLSDNRLAPSSVRSNWPLNPAPLGFFQDAGQFSWLKVLNAGHMAAMDQPKILDLILKKAGV